MSGICLALALALALWLDLRLGEPRPRWHPVVWMGAYLGWMGRHIAPQQVTGRDLVAFAKGTLAWLLGAAVVTGLAWCMQSAGLALVAAAALAPARIHLGDLLLWVGATLAMALLLGGLLKTLLAWAMLRDEVLAVEAALAQSLEAGRERLGWLVSRDVTQLGAAQVRESAIESLAENLNDSVVAPIFWFVLAGLPGAALYRFANTADAMWGYPGLYNGRHWAWAGKWAARADDVLSWLPARLTGALLALLSGRQVLGALRREATRTPSPNSGWPMAAMALALNVRLEKPGVYALHAAGQPPLAAHTHQAVALCARAVAVVVLTAVLLLLAIAYIRG